MVFHERAAASLLGHWGNHWLVHSPKIPQAVDAKAGRFYKREFAVSRGSEFNKRKGQAQPDPKRYLMMEW